ncbi:MAG: UDP-2,4-diacetamido-2,4,6-trideoxy-beta-L-altropyranose hydrolase [Pseudorhodoplanes sp.]|nr:UDP-2,4-diacetamido-2,4,6-trideoxy-beta-L-altropyranose hydrolase [Pseudorhodoplanes sp.]
MASAAVPTLRPARAQDSDFWGALRNLPSIVATTSSGLPVDPADHARWFTGRLADPNCLMLVAELSGEAFGQVRFDRTDSEARISIALAPGRQGQGLGPRILREAVALAFSRWPLERVVACIRTDNPHSAGAFQHASFHPADRDFGCPPQHRTFVCARKVEWSGRTAREAGAQPCAVFRADANVRIGGGHVHRCLALADTLHARGWRVGFAIADGTSEAVPAVLTEGFELLRLQGDPQSELAAMQGMWPGGVDVLIVDHYGRGTEFESGARGWARSIVAFEDLDGRAHAADLLVDPAPGHAVSDYAARLPAGAQTLLGPDHAPLRPEWAQWRPVSLQRDRSGPVWQVVVSVSATDPQNVTGAVVRSLATLSRAFACTVVLGPSAPFCDDVTAAVSKDTRFSLVTAPSNLAEIMSRCDVAIGAAGVTSWERCCLGLPSIVLVIVENQRRTAQALERAGAAIVLDATGTFPASLAQNFERLADDGAQRAAMAAAAATMCDGRGIDRIADAIWSLVAASGAAVVQKHVTS